MRRSVKRWGALALVLAFSVMCTAPAFAQEVSGQASPILEVQDIDISSGSVYDLSAHQSANNVLNLDEGTIFVEFLSTSTAQYQSLFSVSNPTTGNQNRHFHLYVTPDGVLGMELRNNDSDFKYTMASPEILRPGRVNRVAVKADAAAGTYKLFANGRLVSEMSQSAFKFFDDITGAANISLGGTVRQGAVAYPFGGTIYKTAIYAEALSDIDIQSMTEAAPELLLQTSNEIPITSGSYYDLTTQANAGAVQSLNQGTIIVSYATTSTEEVQSLFSVGNSTSGNKDRHFHIYITDTGALGMELRNTDISFKYTLSRPAALDGLDHGQPAVNTVAFKADPLDGTYKLFINGDLLATLNESDWKFIRDISGVNNIALGATLRNGEVDYPFGGTIYSLAVYNDILSDEELMEITGATEHGTKIYQAGDATNANYYRIPTLLTLKDGTVVSSIDARYGGTHDARSNIDIAFSRSTDGGITWSEPTLPLVFDDYAPQAVDWPRDLIGKNIQISGSAAFIDSVLLQDQVTERLFLFADAFPYGKGFNNAQAGTGFKEIDGKKYLKLHWHEDILGTYNYTIRENGVIYDDSTNTPTEYSVDGDYRLMKNGQYLTQKQYEVYFSGLILHEEKTDKDVNMCVFYKDSLFTLLPTNYLVMKYSDDGGLTWSDMNILGDFRDVDDRMVLFGPGVGTQIQNGQYAGRLLISAYNSVSGDYGYLYSDDHGDSWNYVDTSLGDSDMFAEAQIVELPDGTLQTYMRTNIGKIGYITSIDGGMTWSEIAYIPGIDVVSYGTQLSVIRHSQTYEGKSVLFLSTPTSGDDRRGGKILIGLVTDTGGTGYEKYSVDWSNSYTIDLDTYGFSYSCMTELPDHRIGLLYEKYDSWSRDELHLKNVMRYDVFTFAELTGQIN